MPILTLGELQALLGGQIQGDPDIPLESVASLEKATSQHLSFVTGPRYLEQAQTSRCGALIAPASVAARLAQPCLIVDNPLVSFARAVGFLFASPLPLPGIHPSAVVDATALIASGVEIGPGVVIEAGASLGKDCKLGAHCVVGQGAEIGEGCQLHPQVTIQSRCIVGDRCILHPGCVIGSDGFGNAWDGDHWVKIPQIGRVVLGNDVEIGANTTIDRGALDDTVIEDGVRLDNLIQIAHNCRIGRNTAIAACTGIAGSTRIGANCQIGGAAMIIGHLEICDGVRISAGTFVAKDIRTPGAYTSTQPLMPHEDWKRNAAHLRHLDALAARVKALEKQLKKDAS